MKQSRFISVVIATLLLFCSADVFAQRSRGGGSGGRMEGGRSSGNHSSSGSGYSSVSHSGLGLCCGGQVRGGGFSEALQNYYTSHENKRADNRYRYTGRSSESDSIFEVSGKTATTGSFLISHSTGDFYYRNGLYYVKSPRNDRKYVIHKPYCGFRVPYIPASRSVYAINDISYYFYCGTYYVYDASTSEYVVVTPPVGLVVDRYPYGAEGVVVDDELYYIYDDVLYKAVGPKKTQKYEISELDEEAMHLIKDFLASTK